MSAAGDGLPGGAGGTLTVLGCDGSYPGPGGAASGYLVEAGDTSVWLDAGPGTFAALQLVADPGTLAAVVLTHEHPDHWSDVDSYCVWLRQHQARPVAVYAAPGVRGRSYFADAPELDWQELSAAAPLVIEAAGGGSPLCCTFAATDHGPPTLAVRFDRGVRAGDPAEALAYSADTGPGWSPSTLGRGLGTLLCEATFTADQEGTGRHLSGRQAGALSRDAGVEHLVLTHRRPTVAAGDLGVEAEAAFHKSVDQAAAGRVLRW